MSDLPQPSPEQQENRPPEVPETPASSWSADPKPAGIGEHRNGSWRGDDPAEIPRGSSELVQPYQMPPPILPERIPHMGHVAILTLLALIALFCASLSARVGIHFHLFGATTLQQAANEIHYTLGTEGIFYVLTYLGCLLLFPLLWHRGFMDGLQWEGATAWRRRAYLFSAAGACFVLAIVNGLLMPGPADAPIDKMFRLPGAAWMLFVFGVTLAPFFEELAFRGFLLPALCTAFDWVAEKAVSQPPHSLAEDGHPRWSFPAMIVAATITSILFAFMHADQTGYAVGPFLLLVCVSIVLCWVRLGMRSLAASVLVHASYNFMLFSLMFLGTSGFRHLDKM